MRRKPEIVSLAGKLLISILLRYHGRRCAAQERLALKKWTPEMSRRIDVLSCLLFLPWLPMRDAAQLEDRYLFTQRGLKRVLNGLTHKQEAHLIVSPPYRGLLVLRLEIPLVAFGMPRTFSFRPL